MTYFLPAGLPCGCYRALFALNKMGGNASYSFVIEENASNPPLGVKLLCLERDDVSFLRVWESGFDTGNHGQNTMVTAARARARPPAL